MERSSSSGESMSEASKQFALHSSPAFRSEQHRPQSQQTQQSQQQHQQQLPPRHARISTIPEESAEPEESNATAAAASRERATSSPTPNSVSATSGSATTPTSSIGNASSAGDDSTRTHNTGPGSEFPTQFSSTEQQQLPSNLSTGSASSNQQYERLQSATAIATQSRYSDVSHSATRPNIVLPTISATQRAIQSQHQQQQETFTSSSEYNTAAIKLLVSNNVAGSIIGRAGQTISELQSASQTRIKLSQSGDYYPGTQDRVCLVQGDPACVKVALHLLLERMYLLQENQHAPAWQQQQLSSSQRDPVPMFDFVVRLLVPLSCCGMIIGKSGSNIKFLEETTGVTSIRLSPKDDDPLVLTSERTVTITGSALDSCLHCVYLVVNGMASHLDVSRYSNMTTSYASCLATAAQPPTTQPNFGSSAGGVVPSRHDGEGTASVVLGSPPFPTQHLATIRHSPPDEQSQQQQFWHVTSGFSTFPTSTMLPRDQQQRSIFPRRINSSPDLPTLTTGHQQQLHPPPNSFPLPRLYYDDESRQQGYSEEKAHHFSLLYSSLMDVNQSSGGVSLANVPQQQHQHHQQPLYMSPRRVSTVQPPPTLCEESDQYQKASVQLPYGLQSSKQPLPQLQQYRLTRPESSQSVTHSASAPNLLSIQLEPSLSLPSYPAQPLSYANSESPPSSTSSSKHGSKTAFSPQTPIMFAPGCFNAQILIPDSMIGSVLGRGGQTLTELQMMSGTRIRISQRGEYMPGTRSRIVTIRGPTAQTVWQAQLMISQQIVLPPTAFTSSTGTTPQSATVSHVENLSEQQQQHDHHHHHAATRILSASNSASKANSSPPN